ncbi:MAG: histidinol-phosphate aminotransferase family protein [Xanthomonadaceae bacterium]|nr:histidinol-phosphate aminotransferase family protein [Xanthomonadaceae bacterium]
MSAIDKNRRRLLQAGALGAAGAAAVPVAGWASALQSRRSASVAAAVAEGAPIRLDLNESAFGPSPRVETAIREACGQIPRYVGADQTLALQRQIAALEGVEPEQVILGEVLEALGQRLAMIAGDAEFVYSVPGYTALVDAAGPFMSQAIEVPLNDRLENDLPALLAAISDRTTAVFVVNPHNPSGTVSERGAFDAFVRTAARETLVIVDEAYLDYLDDAAARSAVRWLRAGHDVMVFRTLGKIHALAGLQIGYALAPLDLALGLQKHGVIGAAHAQNQLSIAAASASLADPAHIADVRARTLVERSKYVRLLEQLKLRYAEPAGNFVFFDSGHPHAEVAGALLAKGIKVAREFPRYQTWIRITVGTPEQSEIALRVVREVLESR